MRQLLAADLPFAQELVDPNADNGGLVAATTDAPNPANAATRRDGGGRASNRTQSTADAGGVEYSIDGSGNNLENPEWGSAGTALLRLGEAAYSDGISAPAGEDRPSAREVSNVIAAQTTTAGNERLLTDITWLWGQFIDHDIDLTEGADPAESDAIDVPAGDAWFDPEGTGEQTISFNRSVYDPDTGASSDAPRAQINSITAFLDGSVIYGADEERAAALRTFEGGTLKTSEGDLLPFNEAGLDNAGGPSSSLFLAGDVRANENAALTAMQTLWIREHNRLAEQIAAEDPTLSDEQVFQQARSIVTAELQAITYNEFLPALLGDDAIATYQGYDSSVNPGIANLFSTAAYRFGHSMLSSELLRQNNDGTTAAEGNLSLRDAFFAPGEILDNGIDSLLLGATAQVANEIDNQVVDDIRNFLFGAPGQGGFDLASLNIQRGRDHGLADYNQARLDAGLEAVESFADITSDPELAAKLESLYGDVNNVDVWVGGLAEDHLDGSSLGELFTTVIADQFERIRDGDANWYQTTFSGRALQEIESTTLADVIERNTEITGLRANVFYDESVLYFAADGQSNLNVVVADGQVELVNGRSGEVLESRSVADVSQVRLVGSDSASERFTIDLSRADAAEPLNIVIHGGQDRGNSIDVLGTPGDDAVTVNGSQFTVNGTTIEYAHINQLRWSPGAGVDSIDVVAESEARLVVDDGAQRPGGTDAPRPTPPRPRDQLAGAGREQGRRTSPIPLSPTAPANAAAIDEVFAQFGDAPPDDLLAPRGGRRGRA